MAWWIRIWCCQLLWHRFDPLAGSSHKLQVWQKEREEGRKKKYGYKISIWGKTRTSLPTASPLSTLPASHAFFSSFNQALHELKWISGSYSLFWKSYFCSLFFIQKSLEHDVSEIFLLQKQSRRELNCVFSVPTWLWFSFKAGQLLLIENFPNSCLKKTKKQK